MHIDRRQWLVSATATATYSLVNHRLEAQEGSDRMLIIDTHQHLWNLDALQLPWLTTAESVLRRSYTPADYRAATEGLNIQAVYMEVDVATTDHDKEAEYVIGLCRSPQELTRAAVIGGRPASPKFGEYVARHQASGVVRGVRQVLHAPDAKRGMCLEPDFVRGVRLLGERKLSFDLCMRPTEISDAIQLARACPDTRLILDHCGNGDPKAFGPPVAGEKPPAHDPDTWKRDIEGVAKCPNVLCKISGIVAAAPKGWTIDYLAPIVNHCLDSFGPDRVVFGGDWPVCLLGSPLRRWIDTLQEIVSTRPIGEQKKLWHENAQRYYFS